MSTNAKEYESFEALKARLDEIVAAVSDDALPLDDALDLYEEAVALGMRASDLLEAGIKAEEEASEPSAAEAADAAEASEPGAAEAADGEALQDSNPEQDAVQPSALD